MNEKRKQIKLRRAQRWLQRLSLVALVVFSANAYAQGGGGGGTTGVVIEGSVYGGGRKANVNGNAKVTVKDGDVYNSVYGGNDISGKTGNPGGSTNAYGVYVTGGIIRGNVFGGANGYYGCHGTEDDETIPYTSDFSTEMCGVDIIVDNSTGGENLNIPTITKTHVVINGVDSLKGNVYGGGNLAPVSNSSDKSANVVVELESGYVKGSAFGGGRQASVYGLTDIHTSATSTIVLGSLYGGNDVAGNIAGTRTGGTALDGTTSLNGVSAYVKIQGKPTIGNVFGGGNGDYIYHVIGTTGTSAYRYNDVGYASAEAAQAVAGEDFPVAEVCSINKPTQASVLIDIDMDSTATDSKGHIDYVYGGGNAAEVTNAKTFILGEGHVENAFAGGNGATATTSATITVNATKVANFNNVGTVFGGNNKVAMDILPTITLTKGRIVTVYGGGNAGDMLADITTKVSGKTLSTYIEMNQANVEVGTIYGGCNKANVENDTYIKMTDGTVGTIYGACNISGDVTGASNVLVSGGTITDAVFGGANGYYGCPGSDGNYAGDFNSGDGVTVDSDTKMPTINTTNVTINGGTIGSSTKNASVYGGGNMASVGWTSGTGALTGVANLTITTSASPESTPTINGSVYGGGNMASVYGVTNFLVDGGTINGNVYGGNDKTGNVTGDGRNTSASQYATSTEYSGTTVPLTKDNAASYVRVEKAPTINGSVFGGGNGDYTYYTDLAAYTAATATNKIFVCTDQKPVQHSAFVDVNIASTGHIDNVYAGGNNATVGNVVNDVIGSANVWLNQASVNYSTANIGTIFGGNNKADMNVLPNVILNKGNVTTVYGGGNQGRMLAAAQLPAITAGSENTAGVTGESYNFSTFVALNGSDAKVNTIYGGCNQADVAHNTYVRVKASYGTDAIPYIFGGNDKAGNVGDTAFVDILGGTVGTLFAGSNGMQSPSGTAYSYGASNPRPHVGKTYLNLKAGEVTSNIYGGGWGASTGDTYVTIDGTTKLTGEGAMIFGGGCGNTKEIGRCNAAAANCFDGMDSTNHVGNVTGTAHLDLKKFNATGASIKKVYGGGHAGDVNNVELHLYPTWDYHLDNIYGGCYASNVYGTTHSNFEGATDKIIVDYIYGGNDYAGYVNNTVMDVRTGKYISAFGGGNGAYVYDGHTPYQENGGTETCRDTVPVSYQITMNLDPDKQNQLTFTDNVYGGGNEGYVYNYCNIKPSVDNSTREVTWSKVDGTALTPANSYDSYADYGLITVNIHGGEYGNNVHAGGKGNSSRIKHIIYGLKVLNMDGGDIAVNLYGGSEAVNDGYSMECTANASSTYASHSSYSTMRPSSIINVIGGTIGKNIYGGGYEGNIYGSTYVNVGRQAVYDSYVWKTKYKSGSTDPEYAALRVMGANDVVTEPFRNAELFINGSIYSASDWGEAGDNPIFNTPGVYGGETRMRVDGKGYNTTLSTTAEEGEYNMEIKYSLIGAGTSTDGGDILSHIHLLNYGDYTGCTAARTLYSIQRADTVIADHAFIELKGESDAFAAFPTANFSLARIDYLTFHDRNVFVTDAPSEYILHIRSEKADGSLYASSTLNDMYYTSYDCATNRCAIINPAFNERPSNTIYVNNGTYVKMQEFTYKTVEDGGDGYTDLKTGTYGYIEGYLFFLAEDGTAANVFARVYESADGGDGGLVSTCQNDNNPAPAGATVGGHSTETELPSQEVELVAGANYNYRKWSVPAQGTNVSRSRAITIIATSDVSLGTNHYIQNDSLPTYTDASSVTHTTEDGYLAYATASIELPPSQQGNYYKISGITIDQANGEQLTLVDAAYNDHETHAPGDSVKNYVSWAYTAGGGAHTTFTSNDNEDLYSQLNTTLLSNPNLTFGLLMQQGTQNGVSAFGTSTGGMNETMLSGNEFFEQNNGFTSNPISRTDIVPVMDFTLTYSPNITTTIVRDVVFNMDEYDAAGNEVGPVKVTVTIATVVRDLRDIDVTMLAMYNEGVSNVYTRNVVLPATMAKRPLTLQKVKWQSVTTELGAGHGYTEGDFGMVSTENTIDTRKEFSLKVTPVEVLTDNISSSLGWFAKGEPIDVYQVVDDKLSGNPSSENQTAVDVNKNFGTLDGRATASVDIAMNYNGNLMYKDLRDPYAGTAVLTFGYRDELGHERTFDIKIHVKTRASGDTIYLASKQGGITRNGFSLTGHEVNTYGVDKDIDIADAKHCGKYPNDYLHSFDVIMKKVYQEGDVICILDTVKLDNNITVRGTDYSSIQVIRYSGSHYEFPGEKCAYRGPMMKMSGAAKEVSFYNMWFNGSGLTKVKKERRLVTTDPADDTEVKMVESGGTYKYYRYNSADSTSPIEITTSYSHATNAGLTEFCSEYYPRERDTLFADAPIFWIESGSLTLYSNVKLSNNFNAHYPVEETSTIKNYYGGAIGIGKTDTTKGTVVLGTMVVIEDNAVVDHSEHADLVGNYGGAVYVDGGELQLAINKRGVGTNNIQTVVNNYYLTATDATNLVINSDVIEAYNRDAYDVDHNSIYIPEYRIDKAQLISNNSLYRNNVYLTRTPMAGKTTADDEYYQKDAKSDLIKINQSLHKDSRIGVSKWFPGDPRKEVTLASGTRYEAPRDTIMFATGTAANSAAAFNNQNFILDRAAGSKDYSDSNYFVFYHKSVSPTLIYLQRCATFQKKTLDGTEAISFMDYKMNSNAVKPDGTDMINVKLTGGFLPYTYSLYSVASEGADIAADATPFAEEVSEAINTTTDATLRAKAEDHDMLLSNIKKANQQYNYYIMGSDLTGNCAIGKKFSVKVVQCQESPYRDTIPWLNSSTSAEYAAGYTVPNAITSNWNETGEVHIFSDTNLVNVARALRTFKGFHLNKFVDPDPTTGESSNHGTIASYVIDDPTDPSSWKEVDFIPSGTDPNVPAVPDKGKTGEGDHIYTPGDVVKVTAVYDTDDYDFMMWDFDPSNPTPTAYFVVPTEGDNDELDEDGKGEFTVTATAYFAPRDYWWQNVTSLALTNPAYYADRTDTTARDNIAGRQYRVANSGTVTISGPLGLAWLISTVNGYNGENARTFAFDTIIIQGTTGSAETWDMSAHKWTPLGNMTNVFEGIFISDPNVTIKNITINESEVPYVGFFGHTQEARVSDVKLAAMVAKGNNYVGGVVAFADNATEMIDPSVKNSTFAGAHSVAPIAALAKTSTITGAAAEESQIVGYSIYSAGLVAEAEGSTITNATSSEGTAINPTVTTGGNGTAMVSGGVAAKTTSSMDDATNVNSFNNRVRRMFGLAPKAKYVEVPTVIENCYVRFTTSGETQNRGGLVGFADNTQMSNSYVYGAIKGTELVGSLAAMVGDGVSFDHCYYQDATGEQIFGYDANGNSASNTSSFKGKANQVTLQTPVDGVQNLTRALNKWVFAHDTSVYKTWRSDLEAINSGYPVFGTPDIIPVFDTLRVASCEMYDWDGIELYESGSFSTNTVDSTEFIDSTFTLILTINHGDSTYLVDSVMVGSSYEANGFYFTEEQINDFFMRGNDFTVVDFTDTLQTVLGCDSVVSLKLYILGDGVGIEEAEQVLSEVKVYPNPTLAYVTVEATDLKRVELYDQLSRLVDVKAANGSNKVQFDLTNHSTGSYYLRIETSKGVVVRKVIKK